MTKRAARGIGSAGRAFAASVSRLAEALEFAERYPLPQCIHGNTILDGAGERLEPTCGCRADAEEPKR